MPRYRVVAQRLFEQAEGLQVLGGASGDEPCAPAAPAEIERHRPERQRTGRCPMMARRGATDPPTLCPGPKVGAVDVFGLAAGRNGSTDCRFLWCLDRAWIAPVPRALKR